MLWSTATEPKCGICLISKTHFNCCCSFLCFLANQINVFAFWPHVLLGHVIHPRGAGGRKQESLWVGVCIYKGNTQTMELLDASSAYYLSNSNACTINAQLHCKWHTYCNNDNNTEADLVPRPNSYCTFLVRWRQNLFNLLCKAHVQHLVNFIQDHMFKFAEVQFIVLNVVFDATRCPNQNVDSITDGIN